MQITDLIPMAARMYGSGDSQQMVEATNDFIIGFFDANLKKSAAEFPKAVLDRHPGSLAPHRNIAVRESWSRRN